MTWLEAIIISGLVILSITLIVAGIDFHFADKEVL